MNERILELAKQAKMKSPSENALSPPEAEFAQLIIQECIQEAAMIGIANFENEDISWTAEKIVKECLEQGKLIQTEDISNASEEYLLGRQMGIEVYMNRIREHFGV